MGRRWKDFHNFGRRFQRSRSAVWGLLILAVIFCFGWGIPIFFRIDSMKMVGDAFLPPSGTFFFGTDDVGRDVFAQVVVGAQTSILIGITAAAVSTVIGLVVGAISGYYGGKLDSVLMRATEFFMVIPRFFLALIMVAILGASIWNIIFAIGILSWPRTARIVRGEFLRLRNREFVDSARVLGLSDSAIMFSEILPNASPAIIVNTALEVGSAITIEAGISFLGLGDPQQMSWGVILYQAQMFMRRAPWISLFAGGGIFLTVMGLNLLADGLNETLNPKLRRLGARV
jgi:peptide/nickel transport system permease protein